MNRVYHFTLAILILIHTGMQAQENFTQTIRGTILDATTEMPLPGATVILDFEEPQRGTTSNTSGEFRFEKVVYGRHSIRISFMGYKPAAIPNIELTAGKEIVLSIRLEEMIIETEEIVVKAYSRKDQAINEMTSVSARSFTIEETERFAGSLGDPSRMASNYAGVLMVNDQRNDIVIRGNSPQGLLWRLEGIDVPNPNHFGATGTTGGPVSMLNNNVLANSDFLTGAFPSEYGNAVAGAFDLRMRPGNNEKHEFLGQVGFNGFEAGAEGPLSTEGKSSYLINFRYSTMEVMHDLGMDFGTGDAIPEYKDITFKLNFPLSNKHRLSIWGLGGLSYIELLDSKNSDFGFGGTDVYFGTDMGVTGIEYNYYPNEKTKITNHFSASSTINKTVLDSIHTDEEQNIINTPFVDGNFKEFVYQWLGEISHKFNAANNIQVGINTQIYDVDYQQKIFDAQANEWFESFGESGIMSLYKGYLQWQHKFSDKLVMNSGLHTMYFALSESFAVEPRLGIKWQVGNDQSLSAGFGMHSQLQTRALYLLTELVDTANAIYELTNDKIDFNKSMHFVVGYDVLLATNLRLKIEAYYQHLYNIPVHPDQPEFSLINQGDNFTSSGYHHMINQGKAYNYGTEFTVEKFLTKGYYYLFTASIFESKYSGYDEIFRNSAFNGNYVFNLLGGYEFKLGRNILALDIKTVYAGGKRFVPIDIEASKAEGNVVYDWENAYKNRLSDYFRLNARITFKLNGKKIAQEWGLDLQNLTNHENIYMQTWNNSTKELETSYQSGFMPMMTYRLRF